MSINRTWIGFFAFVTVSTQVIIEACADAIFNPKSASEYAKSEFAMSGLTYDVFKRNRKQIYSLPKIGYSQKNIAHAIIDRNELSLDEKNFDFLKAAAEVDKVDPDVRAERLASVKNMLKSLATNVECNRLQEDVVKKFNANKIDDAKVALNKALDCADRVADEATDAFLKSRPPEKRDVYKAYISTSGK